MIAPRRAIDWDAVRQRLAAADDGLQRSIRADGESLNALYRKRAERLARRRSHDSAPDGCESALVFGCGGRQAAIELSRIRRVARMPLCTPMPGGRPELCGIINDEGALRRVWDIGRLLNPGAVVVDDNSKAPAGYLLALQAAALRFHVRVESVERIERIDVNEAPPRQVAHGAGATVDQQLGNIRSDGLILVDTTAVALRLGLMQQGALAPAWTANQGSCQ